MQHLVAEVAPLCTVRRASLLNSVKLHATKHLTAQKLDQQREGWERGAGETEKAEGANYIKLVTARGVDVVGIATQWLTTAGKRRKCD